MSDQYSTNYDAIPNDFLDYVLSTSPTLYRKYGENPSYDDKMKIYNYGVTQGLHNQYEGNTDWSDAYSHYGGKFTTEPTLDEFRKESMEKITSPHYTQKILNGIHTLGTDESSDLEWRMGHNASLTGWAHAAAYGEAKFDEERINREYNKLEGWDRHWVDIKSTVISFMQPADYALLSGFGKLGFIGAKALGFEKAATTLLRSAIGNRTLSKGASIGLDMADMAAHQTFSSGVQLTAYEGAKGGLMAHATGQDVLSGVAGGIQHGGAMALAMGIPGGGLTALNMRVSSKMAKALTSAPARIGVEAGVFTAPEAYDMYQTGEWDGDKLLATYLKNYGTFGLLRVSHKVIGGAGKHVKTYRQRLFNRDKSQGAELNTLIENVSKNLTAEQRETLNLEASKRSFRDINEFKNREKELLDGKEKELIELEEDLITITNISNLLLKGKIKSEEITEEIGPKTLRTLNRMSTIYKELAADSKKQRLDEKIEPKVFKADEILELQKSVETAKIEAEKLYKQVDEMKDKDVPLKGLKDDLAGMTGSEAVKTTKNKVNMMEQTLADALLGKPISPEKTVELMAKFEAGRYQEKHEAVEKILNNVNEFVKENLSDIEVAKEIETRELRDEYRAYHFDTVNKQITEAAINKLSVKQMQTAVDRWKGEKDTEWVEYQKAKAGFISVKSLLQDLPVEIGGKERSIPLVAQSNISDANKAIIIYKLNEMGSGRAHAKAAKIANKLAEFIESKYGKKKHFLNLTKGQSESLAKDYIQEAIDIKVFDMKPATFNKKYKPVEIERIGKEVDKIYGQIAEIMAEGRGRGNLASNLKGDPMPEVRKFGIKGTRKVHVVGGEEGLNKWWQWIKNQSKVISFKHSRTKKTISFNPKEAELITRIIKGGDKIKYPLNYTPRPEEIGTILKMDVVPGDKLGDIKIKVGKRKKGEAVKYAYINDKKLAQEILQFAKNKNADDKIFDKNTTSDINQLYLHVAEKSKTPVLVEHVSTKNFYRPEDKIQYPAVGKLPAITETAGKGLQAGRAFRYDYIDEFSMSKDLTEATVRKGHEGPRATLEYQLKEVRENEQLKYLEGELREYGETFAGVKRIEKEFKYLLDLIGKNPQLETKTGEFVESKTLLNKLRELKIEEISEDVAIKIIESQSSFIDKAKLGSLTKEQIAVHAKIESLREFLKIKDLDTPVYKDILNRLQNDLLNMKTEHSVLDAETLKDYKTMGQAEGEAQVDWLRWTKPHLVAEFIEQSKLGTHEGKKILGMLEGHAVKIAKGEATPYEIPHESVHDTVNYIKAHGTRADKAMLKRAMKKMGGEEAFVKIATKYVKPRMVDREGNYLYPKEANALTRSEYSKMRTWLKTFWNHVLTNILPKRMLRGDALKDYAISRVGEMTLKGQIDVSGTTYLNTMKQQFSTKDGPSRGQLMAKISKLEKDMKISPERKLELRIEAGWLPNKNGDWRGTLTGAKDIRVMNMKLDKYRNLLSSDNTVGSVKKHTVNEVNLQYGPPEKWKEFMYNELGIKDLDTATPNQIRTYTSLVKEHFNKEFGLMPTSNTDILTQLGLIPKASAAGAVARAGLSGYDVMRVYGDKGTREIKNKLADRAVLVNSTYIGIGVTAIHNVKKLVGRRNMKHLKAFDTERMIQSIKDKTATKGEIALFVKLKANDKNAVTAKQIWNNVTDFYWGEIANNLKTHLMPSQIKEFSEQLNKDFITDYFMRTHSREWLEAYKMRQLAEEPLPSFHRIKRSAESKAKEDGYKEGTKRFEEKVNELINDEKHINKVQADMYDMINNPVMKISNPHKLERGELHKEEYFNNATGRMVKTYENPLDAMESFVYTYSHYLGNLRYFPEFTDVGIQFGAGTTKANLYKMMYEPQADRFKGNTMGDYVLNILEADLNIGTSRKGVVMRTLGATASLWSIGGLFSELSGVKNVLQGPARQYSVYERGILPINTLRAYGRALFPSNQHKARMKGQFEYGFKTVHKEAGAEQFGIIEHLGAFTFKWVNFFKTGEAINRMTAGIASSLFMAPNIAKLRGENVLPMLSISKSRIKDMLEGTFEFSKEQIKFIETSKLKTPEDKAKWDFLMDKIQYYGHVKNQGGTEAGLLPAWFSTPEGKMFTIYQKIATTIAYDTYKNVVKPVVKYGNTAPMIRSVIGHALVGKALYNLHDWWTGTEPPLSHEDSSFDRIMMYLYRSDLFTVLGGLFSPYAKKPGDLWDTWVMPFAEPIVNRNSSLAFEEIAKVTNTDKSLVEAVDDFTKKVVTGYGQKTEAYKIRVSDHYKWYKKLEALERTYNDKMRFNTNQFGTYALSETSNIKAALKEAVMFRDSKEFKRVLWNCYNSIWQERESKKGGVLNGAKFHEKIVTDIEKVIMYTSPINSLSKYDIRNGKSISDRKGFLQYLKQGGQGYDIMAEKLHDVVGKKSREARDILNSYDERMKNSVSPYFERQIYP